MCRGPVAPPQDHHSITEQLHLSFFSCFVVPDSGSTIFAHGPFPCPGSVVICRCWSHKWKLHKSNHPIFSGWKTTRKISNQPIHPWYAPDLAPSSPLISAASPFTKGFAASHVWAANVNRTRNCCQKNNPVIEISWSLAPSGPKTQQPIVFAYYIPIYIYIFLFDDAVSSCSIYPSLLVQSSKSHLWLKKNPHLCWVNHQVGFSPTTLFSRWFVSIILGSL